MITQPMSKKLRKWERKTRKEAANCKANKGRTLLDLASTRPRSNRIIVKMKSYLEIAPIVATRTNLELNHLLILDHSSPNITNPIFKRKRPTIVL